MCGKRKLFSFKITTILGKLMCQYNHYCHYRMDEGICRFNMGMCGLQVFLQKITGGKYVYQLTWIYFSIFQTCKADGLLQIWDIETSKLVSKIHLDCQVNTQGGYSGI